MVHLPHPGFRASTIVGWILAAALAAAACGSTSTETVTGPNEPKCAVSLTAPAAAIDAGGGSGTVTVTTQPECAWTAAAEASWIASLNPAQGQGSGEVRFQIGANPSGSAREGAIVINNQRAIIRQAASVCQFGVTASATQFPAAGGAGTISVTSPGGCAWTASSDVSWIAVSPVSGAGGGNITFTVALNTGAGRAGTITAGGIAVTIAQDGPGSPAPPPPAACTISLQPPSTSVAAAGGPGTVGVTAGCAWTASSNVPWITFTTPTSGNGNGSVGFNVAANTSVTGRVGSLTIGSATFTVNQAGASGQSCTITIIPTSQAVGSGATNGINVSVGTATGCTWTATSNATWITIAAGGSGSGNGTVTLNVAANTAGARNGTVTIGGQTFTVTQAAAPPPPCTYSINPTSQQVAADGATGQSVAVSTAAGCTWAATSNAPSWLTITAGASGNGSGNVTFNIAANTGTARSGTLTIAGQTFTVNQAAPACSYQINPTSLTVGADPISGLTVGVTAPAGCLWSATSNAGFLDITGGSSGNGSGTVTYRVSEYKGSGSRQGTLTIASQTFTVTQVQCSATIDPQSQAVPKAGGTFSVAVTTQLGCQWSVQGKPSWITIISGASGTGNGTVSYLVLSNTGAPRSDTMSIAGRNFTVNQQ
jgi:all-beta uncharacterized protein/BACON domain-containing protein